MIENIIGIVVVFISFGFIIFIHELGHFLMARRVGIKVHEFALGFGPVLWSKKMPDTETVYALRLFPFGGFVSMEGEDEAKAADPNDPSNFQNKTNWQKIKVIASGPLMNYVVAILLFLVVGFAFGIGEMYLKPKVGKVLEGTPAQKIQLQTGDYIKSIDGIPVTDAMEMIDIIHKNPNKEISLVIERFVPNAPNSKIGETVILNLKVTPMPKEVTDENGNKIIIGIIGFQPDTKALDMRFNRVPPGKVFADCADKTIKFSLSPFMAIAMIVQGKIDGKEVAEGSAGPVGIGQMFFEMYKKGFPALLFFLAIINVLIGVFNLIPFPALDGSRIASLAIASALKKDFDPEKEGLVHTIGFWILMVLVIFFTYNDIIRLFKGDKFF